MDHRKRRKPVVYVLVALFLLAGLQAYGQESSPAKSARLLDETGAKATKLGDGVWTIPYEGKSMKDISVMLGVGDGVLVTSRSFRNRRTSSFRRKF